MKCGEFFCNAPHNCYICLKQIKGKCPNCDLITRSKCIVCSKGLAQCEKCFKRIICSSNCYLKFLEKYGILRHKTSLSRTLSFQSNKSSTSKSSVSQKMINSMINIISNNNKNNEEKEDNLKNAISTDKNKNFQIHLCQMYWCESHIGLNYCLPTIIKSNNLKDLLTKNSSISSLPKNKNTSADCNKCTTSCSSCLIL